MDEWWSKYVGLPFEEKGRGPDTFDCWGALRWIMLHEKGIVLPDYLDTYQTTLDRSLADVIEREKAAHWRPVDDPQAFDAILLKQRGVPMHVGLVTKPGWMIHCESGCDTVHVRYYTMNWPESKVMGFFRYE